MFRFKRLISSLSFRINITLFIVLGLLTWSLVKGVTFVIKRVNNGYNCVMTSKRVSQSIESQVEKMENAIKAGAFATQSKKLTVANSHAFCDSIRSLVNADTVYIMNEKVGNAMLGKKAQELWTTNNTVWTDSYFDESNNPLITLMTPLANKRGETYAILCADISLKWLENIVNNEKITDRTSISISSKNGSYIYASDSTKTTHKVDSTNYREMGQLNLINANLGFDITDTGSISKTKLAKLGWTLEVEMPVDAYDLVTISVMVMIYIMMTILFILMALCIIITLKWYLNPLRTIADATEEISKGNFDFSLPKIKQRTDIKQLRDSFVQMQSALKQYIQDLKYTTEQKVSMERDISIAAQIQQGMLAAEIEAREDIDIHGILRPAKTVGGDIYDYFIRKVKNEDGVWEENLFFCIGDVSGKGVPAALLMTVTGHLFRNISRRITNVSKICSSINIDLAEGNNENMFCTAFVGVLNLSTGVLNYCNAGHNAPILVRNGKASMLESTINLPFGIEPSMKYSVQSLQLQKNDILFLYTDGVTEAENREKKLFGNEATLKAVESAGNSSNMKTLIANVTASVYDFSDGAEQSDDMTILSIKIKRDYEIGEGLVKA